MNIAMQPTAPSSIMAEIQLANLPPEGAAEELFSNPQMPQQPETFPDCPSSKGILLAETYYRVGQQSQDSSLTFPKNYLKEMAKPGSTNKFSENRESFLKTDKKEIKHEFKKLENPKTFSDIKQGEKKFIPLHARVNQVFQKLFPVKLSPINLRPNVQKPAEAKKEHASKESSSPDKKSQIRENRENSKTTVRISNREKEVFSPSVHREKEKEKEKDRERGQHDHQKEEQESGEQNKQSHKVSAVRENLQKDFIQYANQDSILTSIVNMRVNQFDVLVLFLEILKLAIKGREQERIARWQERELQIEHMQNVVANFKQQSKFLLIASVGSGALAIVSGLCPIVGHLKGEWIREKLSLLISSLRDMEVHELFKSLSKMTSAMSEMYKSTGQIQQTFAEGNRTFDQHMSELHKTDADESTRTMEEIKDHWKNIENFLYQMMQMIHDAIRQLYGI